MKYIREVGGLLVFMFATGFRRRRLHFRHRSLDLIHFTSVSNERPTLRRSLECCLHPFWLGVPYLCASSLPVATNRLIPCGCKCYEELHLTCLESLFLCISVRRVDAYIAKLERIISKFQYFKLFFYIRKCYMLHATFLS